MHRFLGNSEVTVPEMIIKLFCSQVGARVTRLKFSQINTFSLNTGPQTGPFEPCTHMTTSTHSSRSQSAPLKPVFISCTTFSLGTEPQSAPL